MIYIKKYSEYSKTIKRIKRNIFISILHIICMAKNEFEQFLIEADKKIDMFERNFQSLKRRGQKLETEYYQKYGKNQTE